MGQAAGADGRGRAGRVAGVQPRRIIVKVRIAARAAGRCGRCLRRSPRYDPGTPGRRWRHLDAGMLMVFIQADAPRVSCRGCGVVTCHIPWARAGAGHTADFDHQVAWLATTCSKTASRPDEGRLAHRRGDRDPGLGRHRRHRRPVRGPAPDRDRRDLLQEGPQVPHHRGRPRHRAAAVGRGGPGHRNGRTVLRRPRARTRRTDHPRLRRRRTLDRQVRGRALPRRGPLRRPVPHRGLGRRRTGPGPPGRLEQRRRTRQRPRPHPRQRRHRAGPRP